MATTHSRTPSPAPPAPLPLTPGPRATLFNKALLSALNKTISACSYANFSACFPTSAKYSDNILQVVWKQIVGGIEEKTKREFEEIFVEKDVVGALNELERLVGMARARREGDGGDGGGKGGGGEGDVAPHLLPPQTLYLAHLAPYLASTQSQLEFELQTIQNDNTQLAKGVEGQRDEIERLVGGLEAVIADIEGANEVMGEAVKSGDIRRDVVEVERELGERGGMGSRL